MAKTLYYDCFAGISGDMNLGALLGLGVDPDLLRAELGRLDLGGWDLRVERVERGGIAGYHVEVVTADDQPHRHLGTILEIIDGSGLDPAVKTRAGAIFRCLAEAESRVHDRPIEAVHFHEVGAIDAIIDCVGAAIALEVLAPARIVASVVELGSGLVDCAHGRLPVPAPATEAILRGVPTTRGRVPFEATTPTGAAILVTQVDEFVQTATLTVERIGYGAGSRQGPIPNLLRVLLAEAPDAPVDRLAQLECNIDDMNPELYGHVMDLILERGARDCWLTPIIMKKGRPAIAVGVLCTQDRAGPLTDLLLRETTTLGVRVQTLERRALAREHRTIETAFGPIQVKLARMDGRVLRGKPEYEDCRRISRERGIPIHEVYAEVARRLDDAG
jgi:pyridinium-3,5-bisthiocarboxylic acid mononucleotide nickel chelatase